MSVGKGKTRSKDVDRGRVRPCYQDTSGVSRLSSLHMIKAKPEEDEEALY